MLNAKVKKYEVYEELPQKADTYPKWCSGSMFIAYLDASGSKKKYNTKIDADAEEEKLKKEHPDKIYKVIENDDDDEQEFNVEIEVNNDSDDHDEYDSDEDDDDHDSDDEDDGDDDHDD